MYDLLFVICFTIDGTALNFEPSAVSKNKMIHEIVLRCALRVMLSCWTEWNICREIYYSTCIGAADCFLNRSLLRRDDTSMNTDLLHDSRNSFELWAISPQQKQNDLRFPKSFCVVRYAVMLNRVKHHLPGHILQYLLCSSRSFLNGSLLRRDDIRYLIFTTKCI